jgi:major membrane immunogen (membrane-anchored lipoprotein)
MPEAAWFAWGWMQDDSVGSGVSMTAGRDLGRALATIIAALVVLLAVGVSQAAAAPTLSITEPQAGHALADTTPNFAGMTDDPFDTVTLEIYEGHVIAGSPVESVEALPAEEAWEAPAPAPLADGVYTAVAKQTNFVLETGESEPVTFGIDTVAPVVSIAPLTTPTNDSTPTLNGSLGQAVGDMQAVSVAIYEGSSVGGTPAASGSASVSGSTWSFTPSALADGTYTAQATQADAVGNKGFSSPVTFVIDTIAPVVSINAPTTPTSDSTPTLNGGAGALAGDLATVTVTVHKGSTLGGPVVEEASAGAIAGAWSHTTAGLEDGTYTVEAAQQDAAGNTGVSSPVSFTVDTEAPTPSLAVPEWTRDTTPTMEGTRGTAAGDKAAVTVVVHKDSLLGAVVQEAQASVNASKWSFTATTLAEGQYVVEAIQHDEAGNVGVAGPTTFHVDTTKPVLALTQPTSPGNDATPTLSGAGGSAAGDIATVTVRVYAGGSASGTPIATQGVSVSASAWSYTTSTLTDGTYTAQAAQSDKAGNTESIARTFVIDTKNPELSITSPSSKEKVLHVSQPTLAGKAGDEPGDSPTVKLRIYEGTSATGAPVATLSEEVAAGKWTTGSTGPRLPSETYTVQAEDSDAAGNISRVTATFTIETNSPVVTLTTPGLVTRAGQSVSGPTRSFSGTAGSEPEDSKSVILKIYAGAAATGEPVETIVSERSGFAWAAGPSEPLATGEYTAQAEQTDASVGSETGVSQPATFTVDADAPEVTLTTPASGSSFAADVPIPVGGSAGTAEGDLPTVTLQVFAGASIAGQAPLESVSVGATAGHWSTALGGLSPGTYTARAQQEDDVKNLGTSAAVTFTVTAPPPPPGPPVASFVWFPATPRVGEPVSIVSTSADPGSQITSFAWSVSASGAFSPGGSVLSTSFPTVGSHVVRLSVTDAAGRSSSVAETIGVIPPAASLLQPFPVVRITGSETAHGVRIGLFTVQAPTGARVTVRCRGRGCPVKPQSVIATARAGKHRAGSVLIVFKRFQRSLRVGAVLEIRVTRAGQIGKYTRFVVRRGKLPSRLDTCLSPAGVKPMACPSS